MWGSVDIEGEPMDSIFSGGPPTSPQNATTSLLAFVWYLTPLVVYPSVWLFRLAMLFLWPVFYLLHTVALPFIWVSQGLWTIVMLPYVFLAKFQAILAFLSAACVLGALSGIGLYGMYSLSSNLLGLEEAVPREEPTTRKLKNDPFRSVADYRASRRLKKKREKPTQSPREEKMFRDMLLSQSSDKAGGISRRGDPRSDSAGVHSALQLSTQTILEEESSSSFG